jgi:hypothetical protein
VVGGLVKDEVMVDEESVTIETDATAGVDTAEQGTLETGEGEGKYESLSMAVDLSGNSGSENESKSLFGEGNSLLSLNLGLWSLSLTLGGLQLLSLCLV